jgi:trehalose 6-phosphate synthase
MAQQSGDPSNSASLPSEATNYSLSEMAMKLLSGRKLIVASNRGPLNFTEDQSGKAVARRDTSRSSEMFEQLSNLPISWVSGAVGAADRNAAESRSDDHGVIQNDVLPSDWTVKFVSPPRRVHHKFYNVICNPLLWFLLHRSWSSTFTPNIGTQEHDAWERGYRAVNQSFADRISNSADGSQIALNCRDYQLMLVPGMIRERHPKSLIHFSAETPWPWPSELELLPIAWRSELLDSLLAADVVSFPTDPDINAFIACVRSYFSSQSDDHLPEIKYRSNSLVVGTHSVRLSVLAPSVRSPKFKEVVRFPQTQRFIDGLAVDESIHTFVTVDRSEPHKNIVRAINAYGELLKRRSDLTESTRFLLMLTPGPTHISAYKRVSEEIRRAARKVNEAAKNSNPVRVYEENNFYRAIAALSIYDTLVSVPVADGVGRSPLDGPIVNTKNGGMILSENDATKGLFGDSVSTVGITDIAGISFAMEGAADESPESRFTKSEAILDILRSIDPTSAARQFLSELNEVDHTQ